MEAAGGFGLKVTGTKVDSDSVSRMQRCESAGCRAQAKLRGLGRMGLLTCVPQCSSAAACKLSFNLKSRSLSVALHAGREDRVPRLRRELNADGLKRRSRGAIGTPRVASSLDIPVHGARDDDTCPSLRRY